MNQSHPLSICVLFIIYNYKIPSQLQSCNKKWPVDRWSYVGNGTHSNVRATLVTIPALLQDELQDLLHHVVLWCMISSCHNDYSLAPAEMNIYRDKEAGANRSSSIAVVYSLAPEMALGLTFMSFPLPFQRSSASNFPDYLPLNDLYQSLLPMLW